jgi:hypothetical protein
MNRRMPLCSVFCIGLRGTGELAIQVLMKETHDRGCWMHKRKTAGFRDWILGQPNKRPTSRREQTWSRKTKLSRKDQANLEGYRQNREYQADRQSATGTRSDGHALVPEELE